MFPSVYTRAMPTKWISHHPMRRKLIFAENSFFVIVASPCGYYISTILWVDTFVNALCISGEIWRPVSGTSFLADCRLLKTISR